MPISDWLVVEIAFGDDPYTATKSWTDVTDDVLTVKAATAKRSKVTDAFVAGRASIVLRDHNRDYDPSYGSSPYAGDFTWGTPLRVQFKEDPTHIYTVWEGFVWTFHPEPATGNQTTTVVALDGLAMLAEIEIAQVDDPVFVGSDVSDLINFLGQFGTNWPFINFDVDPAGNSSSGTTFGRTMLKELNRVASAGGGLIYHQPATGDIVYEDRHGIRLRKRMRILLSEATFGEGQTNLIEEGTLRLAAVGDSFRNVAAVHPTDSDTTYTSGTLASTKSPKTVKIRPPSDVGSQAQGLANFYQGLYSSQVLFPDRWGTVAITAGGLLNSESLKVRIRDRALITWGASVFQPSSLLLESGDIILLESGDEVLQEGSGGAGEETVEVIVTGIEHRVTAGVWRVRFTGEAVEPYELLDGVDDWLMVGDSSNGLVGTHKLGY